MNHSLLHILLALSLSLVGFQSKVQAQLSCPPDTTISCDDPLEPIFTGDIDTGNYISVFFIDSIETNCPEDIVIRRQWIGLNADASSDTCIQEITVLVDTSALDLQDTLVIQYGCSEEIAEEIQTGLSLACAFGIDSFDVNVLEQSCEQQVFTASWTLSDQCRDTSIQFTQTIIVEDLTVLDIDETVIAVDSGNASGSIDIISACTEDEVFYNWSNGDSTANPQNLSAGIYSVTISNDFGCEQSLSFVVGGGTVIDTTGMEMDTTGMEMDTTGMEMDTTGMEMDTTGMEMDTTGMEMDTSGMEMDTSGMEMDTTGMEMDTMGMEMDTMGMEMDTAGMEMDTTGMEMDTTGMEMDTTGMEMDTSGMEMDTSGMEMDTTGMEMDTTGMEMDTTGMEMDTTGMEMDTTGMEMDTSGMEMDTSGMEMDTTGMEMDTTGMEMDTTGMEMDTTGMEMDTTGMEMDTTGMEMDTTGMEMDTTGMEMDTTGMEMDTTGMEMDTTGMEMDTTGMEMDTMGMEMDTAGMEMDTTGMEMDTTGMEMDTTGMEMDTTGMEMDTTGMEMDTTGMEMDTTGMEMDTTGMEMDTTGMEIGIDLDTVELDTILTIGMQDRSGNPSDLDSAYVIMSDGTEIGVPISNLANSAELNVGQLMRTIDRVCPIIDRGEVQSGISAQDIVRGQNIILANTSGCIEDRLAGDVNGNGALSAADLVILRNLILGNIDIFPVRRKWTFLKNNSLSESGICVPISDIEKANARIELIAIKLGDLQCEN